MENVNSMIGVGEQHPVHTVCRMRWRAVWDEVPRSLSNLLNADAGFSEECHGFVLPFV